MTDTESGVPRGGDRRSKDRRRQDRREPVPPWRRPWAFVAYGVLGALVVVMLATAGEDDPSRVEEQVLEVIPRPAVDPTRPPAADAPPVDAYGAAGFERLMAEGQAAVGQRVRAELFCDPLRQLALRNVNQVSASIARLADTNSRVPAAECKWGADGVAATRPSLTLLVPPELVARFSDAPLVTDDFVERRRITGELEWIGRSDALALRTAGVLRSIAAR